MRALTPLLMLVLAGPACAQDLRPFCAERPGKATPPCVIDAGHLQVETGLADAVLQQGPDVTAIGSTEVRYGLARRLEGEVAWTPLILSHGSGVSDATLGFRWAITDPDRPGKLAAAAQVFATAPLATHGFGAGGWTGGVRAPLALSVSGDTTVEAVPEVDVLRDGDGRGTHAGASLTLAVGRSFGATTLGAELWGFVDDDPAGRTEQLSFDLTAARAIGDRAQIDIGANIGLNRATPDLEIYAGVARRF